MYRALLTPKRLISNLFAISPCIVKVIPFVEIAGDSPLPLDFGHGQFTRVDRDFIPQKTIPSPPLGEQTASPEHRPGTPRTPPGPGALAAPPYIPPPMSFTPLPLPSMGWAGGKGPLCWLLTPLGDPHPPHSLLPSPGGPAHR